MAASIDKKEADLQARQERLDQWEREIKEREKQLKKKEKKQIILRLAPSLWQDISEWAQDDFRSINSQIEYILTHAVSLHKNKK